ncbi:unnamed protein product [Candidula unifasciata]|uniref:Glycolipid transfer protein domain-containing protein n=1 Tax=Candidula unifasciata TaxID=100452 RepID=A0A8S3ZZM5_9EUPU|nr:unnamed protein product [Candidula unifasciata]
MKRICRASSHRPAIILIIALTLVFVAILSFRKPSIKVETTTHYSGVIKNYDGIRHIQRTEPVAVVENPKAVPRESASDVICVATPSPDTSRYPTMAAERQHQVFDPEKVLKLFSSCRAEDDLIFIDCYVDAYEELCKLFRLFGTIFTFVTSDVEQKICILREYNKGDDSQEYKTVQSMLQFEVLHELTDNKKKASGARTLLRLHRAMEFISAFLEKLKETNSTVKFSSATSEAYDTTLARHHPWLIRKAVHVALYMLPARQDLLKKMGVDDDQKGMQGISDLISELVIIFNVIEKLYAKDELLNLP